MNRDDTLRHGIAVTDLALRVLSAIAALPPNRYCGWSLRIMAASPDRCLAVASDHQRPQGGGFSLYEHPPGTTTALFLRGWTAAHDHFCHSDVLTFRPYPSFPLGTLLGCAGTATLASHSTTLSSYDCSPQSLDRDSGSAGPGYDAGLPGTEHKQIQRAKYPESAAGYVDCRTGERQLRECAGGDQPNPVRYAVKYGRKQSDDQPGSHYRARF